MKFTRIGDLKEGDLFFLKYSEDTPNKVLCEFMTKWRHDRVWFITEGGIEDWMYEHEKVWVD
jgi:hypothetical protein